MNKSDNQSEVFSFDTVSSNVTTFLTILIDEWRKKNPDKDFLPSDLLELLNPNNYPSYSSQKFTKNVIIVLCYSVIVIVSAFGNFLVLYVICSRRTMRTATNLLMANLTISDLLMTLVTIPFTVARIILGTFMTNNVIFMQML